MEEFVRQNRELVAAPEPVVNQDPWPLGLLRKRVAVRLALEISEPDQPSLVAVECEYVILGHSASLRATMAATSRRQPWSQRINQVTELVARLYSVKKGCESGSKNR